MISSHLSPGSHVVDPMCGTATVSAALALSGFRVTASDELKFPVLHARARLLSSGRKSFEPVADDYAHAIQLMNSAKPIQGLFWREYSDEGSPTNGSRPRHYFTGYNAAKIDGIGFGICIRMDVQLDVELSSPALLSQFIIQNQRVSNSKSSWSCSINI